MDRKELERRCKKQDFSYDKLPLNYEKKRVRNYDNCCDFPATKKVRILPPKEKKRRDIVQNDLLTYQAQVVSWYDNENSYTSQMVRTIKYFAEL